MTALDAQARVIQGLIPVIADASVTRLIPDDLSTPAVVVQQGRAGTSDGITSTAYLDVKAYHPTRDGAIALAQEARTAVLGQAHRTLPDGTGLIDTATVESEPVEMFYSPDVTLVVGTYRIASRDQ